MSMHIQHTHTHTQNEYVIDENQKQRLKKYFNCVGETKEMKRKKAKKGESTGMERQYMLVLKLGKLGHRESQQVKGLVQAWALTLMLEPRWWKAEGKK